MTLILALIILSVILLLHEWGHFLMAKLTAVKVKEFGFGFPPKIFSRKYGETEYSLNALLFGGFNRIEEREFNEQSVGRRTAVLSGGILANIFLGWLMLCFVFAIGSRSLVMVSETASDSPAALAGLIKDDEIVAVASRGESLAAPFSAQTFIEFVNRYRGEVLNLTIKREEQSLNFQIESRVNPPTGQGPLGVAVMDAGIPPHSFIGSLTASLEATGRIILLSFWSVGYLLARGFSQPSLFQNLIGPVGAVALAGQVGQKGIILLLQIMAFLSIGFACFNALPFPALDGGHLLFVLIEKIKGSAVPERFKKTADVLGLCFLFLLMILVTIKDIKGLMS